MYKSLVYVLPDENKKLPANWQSINDGFSSIFFFFFIIRCLFLRSFLLQFFSNSDCIQLLALFCILL